MSGGSRQTGQNWCILPVCGVVCGRKWQWWADWKMEGGPEVGRISHVWAWCLGSRKVPEQLARGARTTTSSHSGRPSGPGTLVANNLPNFTVAERTRLLSPLSSSQREPRTTVATMAEPAMALQNSPASPCSRGLPGPLGLMARPATAARDGVHRFEPVIHPRPALLFSFLQNDKLANRFAGFSRLPYTR